MHRIAALQWKSATDSLGELQSAINAIVSKTCALRDAVLLLLSQSATVKTSSNMAIF